MCLLLLDDLSGIAFFFAFSLGLWEVGSDELLGLYDITVLCEPDDLSFNDFF